MLFETVSFGCRLRTHPLTSRQLALTASSTYTPTPPSPGTRAGQEGATLTEAHKGEFTGAKHPEFKQTQMLERLLAFQHALTLVLATGRANSLTFRWLVRKHKMTK